MKIIPTWGQDALQATPWVCFHLVCHVCPICHLQSTVSFEEPKRGKSFKTRNRTQRILTKVNFPITNVRQLTMLTCKQLTSFILINFRSNLFDSFWWVVTNSTIQTLGCVALKLTWQMQDCHQYQKNIIKNSWVKWNYHWVWMQILFPNSIVDVVRNEMLKQSRCFSNHKLLIHDNKIRCVWVSKACDR